MSLGTTIEWANAGLDRGASWNPIRARNLETGKIGWHCTHESEGCRNCYAETFNKRLGTGLPYKPGHEKDIEIYLDEKVLLQPLKWREPTGIFVCSMSDAFADFVTDEMLDKMHAVAALCPQHRLVWLTKRSTRMRKYLTDTKRQKIIGEMIDHPEAIARDDYWPLPNCWRLVSVEDQQTADERLVDLWATPAAIRGASFEPSLARVSFERFRFLDWIIAGGESGPKARPAHPDWFRSVRDQCAAAGTAFFFKQWGEWLHETQQSPHLLRASEMGHLHTWPDDYSSCRVGKARAGRLLDGREWNEFPEVPA